MNLSRKKIVGMCVGVFVLGIIVGALAFFGFSKFNEGTKSAENSTEQVQEANQEEQKDSKKSSEGNKKAEDSEEKSNSSSLNSEAYIYFEIDGYYYVDIFTFKGEKLLKLVREITSPDGKSLDGLKKDYEYDGVDSKFSKILEYNKNILRVEVKQSFIDSLNKHESKRKIIEDWHYDWCEAKRCAIINLKIKSTKNIFKSIFLMQIVEIKSRVIFC